MTPDQRADFLTLGKAIEAKSNESRGGGAAGGNLSLAQMQAYEKGVFDRNSKYNMDTIGRTMPQAADFASRLNALRSSQAMSGLLNNPRQGGDEGGVVTPQVAPPAEVPGGTGSASLDGLLSVPAGIPDLDAQDQSVFGNAETSTELAPTPSPLQKLGALAQERETRLEAEAMQKDNIEQKLFKAAQTGGRKERIAYAKWVKENR